MMSLLQIGSFQTSVAGKPAEKPREVAQLALVSRQQVPEFIRNFGADPGTFCLIPEHVVCGPVSAQTLRGLVAKIAENVGSETQIFVWVHKPDLRFLWSMLRFLRALRRSFANLQAVEMNLRYYRYAIIWCLTLPVLRRWDCVVRLRSLPRGQRGICILHGGDS